MNDRLLRFDLYSRSFNFPIFIKKNGSLSYFFFNVVELDFFKIFLRFMVYGVNYSTHGLRSHDSDLALYALRNRETARSLGTGIVYRYCIPWVSPGLKRSMVPLLHFY